MSFNKRPMSKETNRKILQCAINILNMHSEVASRRTCQDWRGTPETNPKNLFTPDEQNDIRWNYEIYNSEGRDYDAEFNPMGDEMYSSHAIAKAIEGILEGGDL